MESSFLILGSVCFVIGFVINYSINRRRFYRRNSNGLEAFSSYERAVGTSCLEKLGKLVGSLLLIIGALALLGYFASKYSGKETNPIKKEKPKTP